MALPKLDARLAAIASWVREGVGCADIGTDHGYLITWLAASGKIPHGFACDINQKPLQKAAFSLSEYGVSERVKLVLCDGLSGLQAGDVQDIVIAGMGGDLIWQIIDAQPWTRDTQLVFLLQPMTKAEHLRYHLCKHGFAILRERAVISKGFPYTILQVVYTGACKEVDLWYCYTGALQPQGNAAIAYYQKLLRILEEKVAGLEKSTMGVTEKQQGYQALLEQLKGALQDDSTNRL